MTHLRTALRALARTPLVAAVAVVSLALGLGANAAIYSIFHRMLQRPLPVAEPERLVNLSTPGPKSGQISSNDTGGPAAVWSLPLFRDLEATELPLALAGERGVGLVLADAHGAESAFGSLVSGGFFDVLGLRPAAGRLLGPADDRPEAAPAAVLDHAFAVRRFGAADAAVGATLRVNGRPATVVGVTPEGWSGRTLGARPDVYLPLAVHPQVMPGYETAAENRRSHWVYVFARLAPGVTPEAAAAVLEVPYRRVLRDVELPLQSGMSDATQERFLAREIVVEPGARGQTDLRDRVRTPLVLLLGVTAFVLLIAAANVANLLLVRASAREGEMAVRLSLGARRHHLVAQLSTESLLLAAAGGFLGLWVARATLRLFAALLPAESDLVATLAVGPETVAFLAVLTAVTALAGLFPALHASRADLVHGLKTQGGRGGGARAAGRFRTATATVQVALSMTLLVSAGLFLRSLVNVSRVELGVDADRLATFGVAPELVGATPEASRATFLRLEEELAALPGVSSVVAARVAFVTGNNWTTNVTVEGFEADPDGEGSHASFNAVGPGFFSTVGMPLLAGRDFTVADDLGAPQVAVVNEAFARKFALGREAVGRRMQVGGGDVELDIEIVGLARDAKYSEVKGEVPPVFFTPWRQSEDVGALTFYLRSPAPERLLPEIRRVVARVAPELPVDDLGTVAGEARDNVYLDRLLTALSGGFAAVATLLAAIGLYGVVAYSVAQRTREIGLRMALGADARRVRRLVLRQLAGITLAGGALGLAAALALGRVAASLLYGLPGHDPVVLATAVATLALVALAAGLVPAERAARIDPLVALRED